MSILKRHFDWAIVASELSHVFCCVLPTLVTILGAFANIGLISAAPNFILDIHDIIHGHEVTIITFSAVMVVIGWIIHLFSTKVDCHNTGCSHPPCTPTKKKNAHLLIIATILFIVNLFIYAGIHRNIFAINVFNTNNYIHADMHEKDRNK